MANKLPDLKILSDSELQELRSKILLENDSWKSSQDGSYEMALFYAGFDEVEAEMEYRNTENKSKTQN